MGNFEPSKLFPPSCLFTSSKNPWLVWREIFQTPFYLFIGYEFSLLTKFQKKSKINSYVINDIFKFQVFVVKLCTKYKFIN